MALVESSTYQALTRSHNLMWGGDKFLMKVLLAVSLTLVFGVRGVFGYLFGGVLLFVGRMALVALAKWDTDALPILVQALLLRKYYLSRAIYPGVGTNVIFTFEPRLGEVRSGVPWYWRIYYWVFPSSVKQPTKFKNIFKKGG